MKYDIEEILIDTVNRGASDLHITTGNNIIMRIDGKLIPVSDEKLTAKDTEDIAKQLLKEEDFKVIEEFGSVDFSKSSSNVGRFRANIYKQRNTFAMALRTIPSKIPTLEELSLPPSLHDLTKLKRGLVLVTGPTGSGKSTTLASMIDIINRERNEHIITLEDPIEYMHKHNSCVINQRELGADLPNFPIGLRAALRQDPDIILVGEMRDLATIEIALMAAETGHLVFSTLHTINTPSTIDRIIDVFPPHQQQQVAIQLSGVLQAVVCQQLLHKNDGGRVVATEIMIATPAIRNVIREKKTHQIMTSIQTGAKLGMHSMDSDLVNLYNKNLISKQTLFAACMEPDYIKRFVSI